MPALTLTPVSPTALTLVAASIPKALIIPFTVGPTAIIQGESLTLTPL
jgi:hypothetical protein